MSMSEEFKQLYDACENSDIPDIFEFASRALFRESNQIASSSQSNQYINGSYGPVESEFSGTTKAYSIFVDSCRNNDVKEFSRFGSVNDISPSGKDIIMLTHAAIINDSVDIIKHIKEKYGLRYSNIDGRTYLDTACLYGSIKTVKYIYSIEPELFKEQMPKLLVSAKSSKKKGLIKFLNKINC